MGRVISVVPILGSDFGNLTMVIIILLIIFSICYSGGFRALIINIGNLNNFNNNFAVEFGGVMLCKYDLVIGNEISLLVMLLILLVV